MEPKIWPGGRAQKSCCYIDEAGTSLSADNCFFLMVSPDASPCLKSTCWPFDVSALVNVCDTSFNTDLR